MIINKILYFHSLFSFFYYIESNSYYFYCKSNSRKINNSYKYIFVIHENQIIKKINLFSYKDSNNLYLYFKNTYTESKHNLFFKNSFYNNKGKIKIVGRGWKIVKYSYQLLIKLGYSHSIFSVLSPLIKYKLKKKKKKYYVFYSVFNNHINTLIAKFNFMRRPNIYTYKGIFNRKVIL